MAALEGVPSGAVALWDPVAKAPYVAGGGGGGAVTIADGADVAQGSTTDPANAPTVNGQLKAILQAATSTTPVTVIPAPVGIGDLTAVPAGTTNGAALGAMPAAAKGARLYLPAGSSVTFTIAAAAPGAAPANTFTVSPGTTGPNWDEDLAGGEMIYVTAKTGAPLFRWR